MITKIMPFKVQLSFAAHALAQEYSRKQSTPEKAKQVYLNTLAVYAVDFYVQCMGFETDLSASDSQNTLMQKFLDVADLEVKKIGKLECRPVLAAAEFCDIPPDVWEDRVAYVAVQFDSSLREAKLLGFVEKPAGKIPLNSLLSISDLLTYLNSLGQSTPVVLRSWYQDIFVQGWHAVQELLEPEQVEWAFSFKSGTSIARGQKIDLGMQLGEKSVALIVILPPGKMQEISELDIKVQVHPLGGEVDLPEGLRLTVMDEFGCEVLQAKSREADQFIQLEFSAELGDKFSVSVAWEDVNIVQCFCL